MFELLDWFATNFGTGPGPLFVALAIAALVWVLMIATHTESNQPIERNPEWT